MDRRTLLASIGAGTAAAFSGCLDGGANETEDGGSGDGDGGGNGGNGTEIDGNGGADGTETDGNGGADGTETDGNGETDETSENGDDVSIPDPDGTCGVEAEPLSSVLVAEAEQDAGTCLEDMTPSFVVENERGESVTAAVEIAGDGEVVFESTVALEPGERAVESSVAAAEDLQSVTVSLEAGEEFSEEWSELACYRHAVAITDDGIEAGYVEPLSGPGDTQHDCYAGDPVPIRVYNGDAPQTATITVVDHCRESVEEEPLSLDAEEVDRLEDVLTNGGRYDVIVDVADGGATAAEFYDACWGLSVSIDEDGEPEIGPMEID